MYLNHQASARRLPGAFPGAILRGSRGLGKLLGFGDVNSEAAAALTAAGYKGVVCSLQTVNNLGGSYTQNQCTASNADGAMNADDVLKLSPANLAQQFASQNSTFSPINPGGSNVIVNPFNAPNYGGNTPAYIAQYGAPTLQPGPAAPMMQTAAASVAAAPTVAAAASPAAAVPAPAPMAVYLSMPDVAAAAAAPAAASSGASLQLPTGLFSSSLNLGGFQVPIWALGVGLLAIPFLFGGKR